jgi:hypothetical protein
MWKVEFVNRGMNRINFDGRHNIEPCLLETEA